MDEERKVIIVSHDGPIENMDRIPENIRYSQALKNIAKEISSISFNRGEGKTSGFLFKGLDDED